MQQCLPDLLLSLGGGQVGEQYGVAYKGLEAADFRSIISGQSGVRIIHGNTDQATGVLFRIDVGKLDECRFVVFETIFFKEERDENAVQQEHNIVHLTAVESIVGELEFHFALDAVGAGEAADEVNVFGFNHKL